MMGTQLIETGASGTQLGWDWNVLVLMKLMEKSCGRSHLRTIKFETIALGMQGLQCG